MSYVNNFIYGHILPNILINFKHTKLIFTRKYVTAAEELDGDNWCGTSSRDYR